MYRKPRLARASRPGSKALTPCDQRAFEIERADHAVFGGAERQVDHRHRHAMALRACPGACGPRSPRSRWQRRVAVVAAADHRAHLRQQRGQRAHRGGLAGAAVTEHQHAADARVDRGDQDRELHLVLADDGGEGKDQGGTPDLNR